MVNYILGLEALRIMERGYIKIANINELINVIVLGEVYGIVYLPINDFTKDLNILINALDYVEKNFGEVITIIPNIGLTPTSKFLLGPSFQGVKGFAIVFKRRAK